MSQETGVERLDFGKPPPGYEVRLVLTFERLASEEHARQMEADLLAWKKSGAPLLVTPGSAPGRPGRLFFLEVAMSSPVIYIAGPYRAPTPWQVEQNIRAAEALALEVWRAGLTPLCPHTMTRHMDGAITDEAALAGTLELMRRCDAVLLVPGWERSTGTQVRRAHDLAATAFTARDNLQDAVRAALAKLEAYGSEDEAARILRAAIGEEATDAAT